MALLRTQIGLTLRRARVAQRQTLRQISRQSNVSLGYLSEIERGQKEASSELLAAICSALALTIPQLLRQVSESLLELELACPPALSLLTLSAANTSAPSSAASDSPALNIGDAA